jgi:hypothetical protein
VGIRERGCVCLPADNCASVATDRADSVASVMRSLAAPLALASAAVALAGCANNGQYCVSPRAGSQVCGAAARAWCDDHSQDRVAREADPATTASSLERLQALDQACEQVGGL